ncbi:MAG TPA: hypothetical protein EYO42_03175 [Candidatus Poseidoniales archaeon]|nr:hypothetical protein [Candidatus Poseidoniales archaeon]
MTLAEVGHGLVLIGTGVGSPTQMSVAGGEYATKSEYRFLEGYTSVLGDTGQQLLETQVGTIEVLMRGDIENPQRILELAKDGCRRPPASNYSCRFVVALSR